MVRAWLLAALLSPAALRAVEDAPLAKEIDRGAAQVLPKVIAWRRDIHQHPELSNREVRTAKIVADHLRSLGLDVRSMAGTRVVGLLRRTRPRRTAALRAHIDTLPAAE